MCIRDSLLPCYEAPFLWGRCSAEQTSKCWDSATCEPLDTESIAAEVESCAYPSGLPQRNSGSHDSVIWVGFGTHVAKTLTYPDCPIICQFPLFVALCDQNPPKLQTDRQTDGRHTHSMMPWAHHAYGPCRANIWRNPFVTRQITSFKWFVLSNAFFLQPYVNTGPTIIQKSRDSRLPMLHQIVHYASLIEISTACH